MNDLASRLQTASDSQLQGQAHLLKQQARTGTPLEAMLVDVFALVREAAHRTIGLRPFDVQIIGGIGLHEGKVVEMRTGEGKTLVAVAPAVLCALSGKGVHVLTFNDYLARRDAEWMGPIYRHMGLTVGFVEQGTGRAERREAYQADVTYLTAKEAGFDFLRDSLAYEVSELVQRPYHVAIVDEADSILIDEARVPLVLAGVTPAAADQQHDQRVLMCTVVEELEAGVHYSCDEHSRNVFLTEKGVERAEALVACGDLYAPANLQTLTELNLALHAAVLMQRDVDYIVRNDRVEFVDDFTGRVVDDRHWPAGLQAAIEAKERVPPSADGRILGSITLQHFLRHYPTLCGMTATAQSASDELFEFYGLEVLAVPPNRPCIRTDHPDLIFTHREAKRQALVAEIEIVRRTGRPILVGTLTVEESEALAADLRASGIGCNVLNAKRDDQEARIVADAGALGAVTISTNMAGRGTDIRLGGHGGENYDRVAELGGLYVIGTNRHESRRIDDQLRGRAGRQGDPGSSRFFVSLEDDLLVRYGIDGLLARRSRPAARPEPIENPILQRVVDQAQRIIEGQNFDIRHTLWRYAYFVELQRRIVHHRRQRALAAAIFPSMLQERAPRAYEEAHGVLGEATLQHLESTLTLLAIDECWSDHLATVTEIRDGIHLAEVGGLSPLIEFQKQAAASFDQLLPDIEARIVERFLSLEIAEDGIDMAKMGLQGPSSTWTYLVTDETFSDRLAAKLIGERNIGFAAGAAMTGPLLFLWSLIKRWQRRGTRSKSST